MKKGQVAKRVAQKREPREPREPKPEPILSYETWCESLAKKADNRELGLWESIYGPAPSAPKWDGRAWVGDARKLRPL